jgi:hypothetical protein
MVPLDCCECNLQYHKSKHNIQTDLPKSKSGNNFCGAICRVKSTTSPKINLKCSFCENRIIRKVWKLEGVLNPCCSLSCAKAVRKPKKIKLPKKIRQKQIVSKQARVVRIKLSDVEILQRRRERKRERVHGNKWGPHSNIFILECAHSGKIFVSRRAQKYSPEHTDKYSRDSRGAFHFAFNIFKFPELFDLDLVKQHGWFSVGGKSRNPVNLTGISRDHRVSVNEAIRNNYDPFYIKHPLNCEIMLHLANKQKHTKSSMSYADLVAQVDAYEAAKLQ